MGNTSVGLWCFVTHLKHNCGSFAVSHNRSGSAGKRTGSCLPLYLDFPKEGVEGNGEKVKVNGSSNELGIFMCLCTW